MAMLSPHCKMQLALLRVRITYQFANCEETQQFDSIGKYRFKTFLQTPGPEEILLCWWLYGWLYLSLSQVVRDVTLALDEAFYKAKEEADHFLLATEKMTMTTTRETPEPLLEEPQSSLKDVYPDTVVMTNKCLDGTKAELHEWRLFDYLTVLILLLLRSCS